MAKNEFSLNYQGTIYEAFEQEIQFGDKRYILEITDTGGEIFKSGTKF